MTDQTIDQAVAYPPLTDEGEKGLDEPLPGDGVESGTPERRRRRTRILFALLALLVAGFLLFAIWYLINRKPVSLPLPGVTQEQLAHYSFSIFGVAAPTGVAVTADGSRIYAVQSEGETQVIEFDGSGKAVASLKPPATSTDHVFVYVALNPTNGDVYVSDRLAGAIYVYNRDGEYLRTFNPGAALRNWSPLGLGFDARGSLFVTNVGRPFQAVHEFGPDGLFVRTIGASGDFNFPNGVAVDGVGNVYVTDSNNGRMLIFDPNGRKIGSTARGSAVGELGLPRGMSVDDSGRVYVADVSGQGVQVYHALATGAQTPEFIGHMGVEGSADGAFEYPNAVATDTRSRVYVADWRNNRIQVWSY